MSLPTALYTGQQAKQLDTLAINSYQLSGTKLMLQAGQVLFQTFKQQWPNARSVGVICGAGNNAGDGYVFAKIAHESGLAVKWIALVPLSPQAQEAQQAYEAWLNVGVSPSALEAVLEAEVLVDAMLGIGINSPVRSPFQETIEKLNATNKPILSVDLPSGLCPNTGVPLGIAVKATCTATFIALKQGMLTAYGRDYCGQIVFDRLSLPEDLYKKLLPNAARIDWQQMQSTLAKRQHSAHKGNCGEVLIIGGAPGMSGAILMSGMAALRAGAGKVHIATHPRHADFLNLNYPELMVHAISTATDLEALLASATVCVVGPGLGDSEFAKLVMPLVTATEKPTLYDADALHWIAQKKTILKMPSILTPHPKEAAVLLNQTTREVQKDRFASIHSLTEQYPLSTIVLKGSGTLVKSANQMISLCSEGNPGMATAGMGDVLTGIIAGLWAQGADSHQAAQQGVTLHAASADKAAEALGQRGLIATDILPFCQKYLGA